MNRYAAVFVMTAALSACAPAKGAGPEPAYPGESGAGMSPVTHGPVLGGVTAETILIWARTRVPGAFHVRYGTSPENLDQRSAAVQTVLDHDNAASVRLTGLKPQTRYHYAVFAGDAPAAPAGSFRTLPDERVRQDPAHNPRGLFNFSFEFACGNNQEPGSGLGPSLPAYDTLLKHVKDRVDFAILNGDWLYEEARDYSAQRWLKQVGAGDAQMPDVVRTAPTICGVWENYKRYLERAGNLAAWHRHVPSYFTFDDHEILNDVIACGETGFRNRRTVFRDIAVQGWFDYLGWANPVEHAQPVHFGVAEFKAGSDVLTDSAADFTQVDWKQTANLHVHWGTPDAGVKDIPAGDKEGGDPNANVYEVAQVLDAHRLRVSPAAQATGSASYSIGRHSYGSFKVGNCRFFLLDTRSHRTLHDTRQPAKPGVTMLGRAQLDWLMSEMKRNDADFYFVVSSVNFMVPHVGGGGSAFDSATKDDAWTVFLEERERLVSFWDTLAQPVMVLSGDLHNSYAIRVTDNVWEFASGPHNSVNHRPEDEGDRPVNGPFQYGPRPCEIRWSTTALGDIPRAHRMFPHYCVIQINNVFNNPLERGGTRWVAYPRPHVVVQFYDGLSGELKYAEAIHGKEQ